MAERLVVSCGPILTRGARLVDGRLVDLFIAPAGAVGAAGDIYIGRVRRVVTGLRAAFVDLGLARDGFLSVSDARSLAGSNDVSYARSIDRLVAEGDAVLVQVRREAVGDKGVRVSADIELPGRFVVFSPLRPARAVTRRIIDPAERRRLADVLSGALRPPEGAIARTRAAGVDAEAIVAEIGALRGRWEALARAAGRATVPSRVLAELDLPARVLRDSCGEGVEVVIDDAVAAAALRESVASFLPPVSGHISVVPEEGDGLFEREGIADEVDGAFERDVPLPGGGRITIDATQALVAIDVDSGQRVQGDAEAVALAVNLEAASTVARQIRLRDLGGAIVVDFLQQRDRGHAERIETALRDAVSDDPAPVDVGRISRFGLLEMTRRRTHRSPADVVRATCPCCAGSGGIAAPSLVADAALRRARAESRRLPGRPLRVRTSPAVAAYLRSAVDLAAFARRIGGTVEVAGDPAFGDDRFDVAAAFPPDAPGTARS
jgi:ribonuclease G